ncbi:hypothetical protein O5833_29435, partial [Escherichia coli]|nr:hypothetical protein [Escherichia coli]
LTYIGVNPYWQYIIKGAIIIFAVDQTVLLMKTCGNIIPTSCGL